MPWNPLTEPQDYFTLGGVRSPGEATFTNADVLLAWVKRRGFGLSYGTSTFRGAELREPEVEIRLFTVEDWDAWYPFYDLIKLPPQGTRPRALDIDHPLLEMAEIRSVTVQKVGQLTRQGDGSGLYVSKIKFLEFNRPEFTLARPEAADTRIVDPVEQEIERLGQQLQALAQPNGGALS